MHKLSLKYSVSKDCESDEMELRDEDDDDCEFSSLEGTKEIEKSKQLPKIQKKFN